MLLLQKEEDWGIKTFRNESQDHDLALGSERKSTEPNQAEKIMFEYADQFLDFFLDFNTIFVELINQILGKMHKILGNFIFQNRFQPKYQSFYKKKGSGHQTKQCALSERC